MARSFLSISSKFDANGKDLSVLNFRPLERQEQQTAELLQIHHKTLQKLARRGEIRGTHIGKLWRFRVSDLNAWFERNHHAG